MTQAPTPGPLTDSEQVSHLAKTLDKSPDEIRRALASLESKGLICLAPTAPVEASGSEREVPWLTDDECDEVGKLRFALAMKVYRMSSDLKQNTRPQPSGETREAVARLISPSAFVIDPPRQKDSETKACQRDSALSLADEILALIRPAPVALGGQHSTATDFPPDDVLACDITPARAEAQDEGAAGEPVAYRQWCQSDKPHQGGWWQLIDKHDGDHAIATGGGKNLRPLYTHPSPTPAADADRVREAVGALTKAKDLDVNLLHDGYDSGPGGGNYVYADVVRTDELFPLLDQALAALKSEGK